MVKPSLVFLFLLMFIVISGSAFAQKEAIIAQYGYNRDSAKMGKPYKLSMIEDTGFDVYHFYDKGYIIMPSGETKTGLVRFDGDEVIYKDLHINKTTRYGAKEIKGFVLARDTFNVSTDTTSATPSLRGVSFGVKYFYNSYFVKLMMYGTKLCLYKTVVQGSGGGGMMVAGAGGGWTMIGGGGGNNTEANIFYVKRPGEIHYTHVPYKKKEFKKVMANYFKDDDAIMQEINNEKLKFDDLEQIVNRYNHKN